MPLYFLALRRHDCLACLISIPWLAMIKVVVRALGLTVRDKKTTTSIVSFISVHLSSSPSPLLYAAAIAPSTTPASKRPLCTSTQAMGQTITLAPPPGRSWGNHGRSSVVFPILYNYFLNALDPGEIPVLFSEKDNFHIDQGGIYGHCSEPAHLC